MSGVHYSFTKNEGSPIEAKHILIPIDRKQIKTPKKPDPLSKTGIKSYQFKGQIGKLAANFDLTFNYSKNSISGVYYYPNRQDVFYSLSGKIMGDQIELTELTENIITATCKLKILDDLCYQGMMFNTDGREIPMSFCKE